MSVPGRGSVSRAVVVLGCALLVATCDHSTTTSPPQAPVPASVEAVRGAGDTVQVAGVDTLAARVKDADGGALAGVVVHWSIAGGGGSLAGSSDTTDATGTARVAWTVGTAVGAGEARASVTGVSSPASFPVTLAPGPAAAVTMSADTARFGALADTATYTASAQDAFGNDAVGALAWASADSTVATVSDSGRVTAVGPGTTLVTAASGAAADTLAVIVLQVPASVSVSPASDTVASGATVTLAAAAADSNGNAIAGTSFTWSSSDSTIAAVDTMGVVEGRVAGSARISAATGALADSAALTVTSGAAASVSVSPAALGLGALADTVRLAAAVYDGYGNVISGVSVAWSSSDTLVATVDSAGLVTAVANGSAQVLAAAGSLADTAGVTVQQVGAGVTVTPSNVVLTATSDTVRFQAAAVDSNGYAVSEPVTWSSTDTTVAKLLDTDGLVESRGHGTASIVAAVTGAADTVALPVQTAAGVSRTWTGAANDAWSAPLSWDPAGAPHGADTTLVAAGTPTSPTVYFLNMSVARVEVASGATLSLGASSLTVNRDALAAGAISATSGYLLAAGTGSVSGNLPRLEVTGTVEATSATTLSGGLQVMGGTFRTQGQTVVIQP